MYNQFEHFVWEYLFAEIVDNFYCCTSPWLKHESKP